VRCSTSAPTSSTSWRRRSFSIIVLFGINWRLALAVVGHDAAGCACGPPLPQPGPRRDAQEFARSGEVNKAIQEAVSGMRVAKNFRQEQAIYDEFMQVNDQAYSINVRRAFVLANIFPTLNALAGVGTAVLVYFGGRSAVAGAISIGLVHLRHHD
jgi:ATP-binding cassette subfamily B protein